ncbi:MAG: hypothetical protein ACH254_22645 [Candidatus Thiodiazotropha endolucinida]
MHAKIQAEDNPQGTEQIAAISATAGEHANIMDMYDSRESSVEIDSDDVSVSELANFCANCNCQPAGVQLKKNAHDVNFTVLQCCLSTRERVSP